MARTPDPVTLSPEENVAADLAFTTSGLHAGNALYNSAAENNILTDGAYGASSASRGSVTTCCCRSSPSRASSRPREMAGQINGTSSPAASRSPARRRPRPGRSTRRSSSPPATTSSPTARRRCATTCARTSPASPRPRCRTRSAGANAINFPGQPGQWSAANLFGSFFQPSGAADVAALNAHYNQHAFQAADNALGTTADPTPLDRGDPGAHPLHHGLPRRAEHRRHARRLRRRLSRLAAGVRQGPGGDVHREHRLRLRRHGFRRALRAAHGALRQEPPLRPRVGGRAVGLDAAAVLRDGRRLRRVRREGARGDDVLRASLLALRGSPTAPTYTPPATTTDPVTGTAGASVSVSRRASSRRRRRPASRHGATTATRRSGSTGRSTDREPRSHPEPPRPRRLGHGLVTDDQHGIKPQLGYPTIDLTGARAAAGRTADLFPATPFTSSTPRRSGSSATSSTSPGSSGRTRPARRRAPSGS